MLDGTNCPPMVLVVDDSPSVCIVTERMLASLGYESRTVESADEALKWIDAEGSRVTRVLLDVGISGVASVDALRYIAHRTDAPLVFVTTFLRSDEERRLLLAAGAAGFIEKPYTMADLANALNPLSGPDTTQRHRT